MNPLLAAFLLLAVTPLVSRAATPSESSASAVDWTAGALPGAARADLKENIGVLENDLLRVSWEVKDGHLRLVGITDKGTGRTQSFESLGDDFSFGLKNGDVIGSRRFTVVGKWRQVKLQALPKGVRTADKIPGEAVEATLRDETSGVEILWRAELRDGSNYVRQTYAVTRKGGHPPLEITSVAALRVPGAYKAESYLGKVPGSPYLLPDTRILAAIEQPGYWAIDDQNATALSMPTQIPLGDGDAYRITTMLGIFPKEQLRRSFLYYLERERASPSRRFTHYNAWYDLGFGISDKSLSKVIDAYATELVKKRGVALDGFVLDDGWDNVGKGLWQADPGRFPKGFKTFSDQLTAAGDIKPGIWISPCGGYGGQKERMEWVKKLGGEPADATKLDLAYPGYFKIFGDICRDLIKRDGMVYFKWDNAAPYENSGRTFGNLKSTAHFMKLCELAGDLRKDSPELLINATVGTWPSPFWLNHVDCTWRMGGADVNWVGKGDVRDKSLNYRDGEVYKMVVARAPLYPLNSMMFHGVVLGHHFQGKKAGESGNEMAREFRSYFALGVNLQELYLSPDLMNAKCWDDLAESIKWNRRHAATLTDTHWVQGDPYKSEPYAYASWRRNEGVLCIRNSDDKPRDITFDIGAAFELPASAAKSYRLTAAYADQSIQKVDARAGIPVTLTLKPFEVLVFDAVAADGAAK